MRARDALERSLTKLPGSVLALCCAEPLLCCTRCFCSCLGCSGAELISLVMVWRFPPSSFHSPAFGSRHLGSSECRLLGKGEEIEGLGTALLHEFFSHCWDGVGAKDLNPALLPAMLGKPARPPHPTAGFTQIREKKYYFNRLVGEKKLAGIFFSQMSEKVGLCCLWADLSPTLLFCCGLQSGEAGSPAAISGGDELGMGDEEQWKQRVENIHWQLALLAAWLGWLLGTSDSHFMYFQSTGTSERANLVAGFWRSPVFSSVLQLVLRCYI